MSILGHLEPTNVFHFFEEICNIPHGSGNIDKISDYLVDFAKEIERLEKEKSKLEKEVDRVVKKLANQGFVAKAPAAVIEEEKAKEEKYKAMLAQVEERLAQLKK